MGLNGIRGEKAVWGPSIFVNIKGASTIRLVAPAQDRPGFMRSRRPRFTIRRLMVAVAFVGMVLNLVNLGYRRESCRRRVLLHDVLEYL